MGKEITNKATLISQAREVEKLKKNNHILYKCNRQALKYFEEKNKSAIEAVQKELDAINDKYCKRDEKGQLEVSEQGLFVLKDESQEPEYNKEYMELCKQPVTLNYL